MKINTRNEVKKVLALYNADHDLGPNAPVTWREERLARAIVELVDDIEELEATVSRLIDAVPSAGKREA